MSDTELVRLLGNKLFRAAIVLVVGGSLSVASLYYALRAEIRENRAISATGDTAIRYRQSIDSLKFVNYKATQASVDQVQNDKLRRLGAYR